MPIGKARIQGLEARFGMHGNQYNIALLVFCFLYILSKVPSNILLKPSNWLSVIILIWGIVTFCQSLVHSLEDYRPVKSSLAFLKLGKCDCSKFLTNDSFSAAFLFVRCVINVAGSKSELYIEVQSNIANLQVDSSLP